MRDFYFLIILFCLCTSLAYSQPATVRNLPATSFLERGNQLHDNGNMEGAIDFYSEALRIDDQLASALYNRGLAYYYQGKYHKALADFDKVLLLDTDDQQAYEHRARLRFLLNDHSGALEDYNKVVSQNPNCILYVNRGLVHLEKKQFENAMQDFDIALGYDAQDQEAWNGKGDAAFALGRYEEALDLYDEALALNPHDARTYNNRANTYKKLGQQSDAIENYDQAVDTENNTFILVNRGFYWMEQGDFQQALADCQEASRLDYSNDRAYYGIGLAATHLNQLDKAMLNLDKAIELNDREFEHFLQRGKIALKLGLKEEAIIDFEQALALGGQQEQIDILLQQCGSTPHTDQVANKGEYAFTAKKHFENFSQVENLDHHPTYTPTGKASGDAIVLQERSVKAQRVVEQADVQNKKTSPSTSRSETKQLNHARNLFNSGRYERAIVAYAQILNDNPEQFAAYWGKGEVLLKMQEYGAAIESFTQAIHFHPEYLEAFFSRAAAMLILNEYDQAIADYSSVILLNPNFGKAYFMRAQAFGKSGKISEALEDLDKCIEIDPRDLKALNERGSLKWKTGNIFGALEDYSLGLSIDQQHFPLLLNRGQLYYEQGQLDKAIADFSEALKQRRNAAKVYFYRGVAQYESGYFDGAISDFSLGLRFQPENPQNYLYRRALAFHHTGEYRKAIVDYEAVLEIQPDHVDASHNRQIALQAGLLGAK